MNCVQWHNPFYYVRTSDWERLCISKENEKYFSKKSNYPFFYHFIHQVLFSRTLFPVDSQLFSTLPWIHERQRQTRQHLDKMRHFSGKFEKYYKYIFFSFFLLNRQRTKKLIAYYVADTKDSHSYIMTVPYMVKDGSQSIVLVFC